MEKMFKLPEDIENKYRFVTLASKRAEQLQFGALPRVADTARKATVIAQEEVATGLVELWTPEDEEAAERAGMEEEEEE
jgi:DNA-directed RNA polymerase omega subunit